MRRGLKQGKLKFTLHGEKLTGSWALVRMGGAAGDGGKNWLLIKHRDKSARPNAKSDFLARHARSVVSGRKMEEISGPSQAILAPAGDQSRRRCKCAGGAARKNSAQLQANSIAQLAYLLGSHIRRKRAKISSSRHTRFFGCGLNR